MEGLPRSVEAVFFQEGECEGVWDGPRCEKYTREMYQRFIAEFDLNQAEVPLLRLVTTDWQTPFRLA